MTVAPSETSQRVLCKQYLLKGDDYSVCPICKVKHETLDELMYRVSFGDDIYREMLSKFDFLPNSPTLFNAGTNGTLSACFKFDVDDSMESILDVGRKSALVQKWGGGVGYCLSALRPEGAPIRSTHGTACGPIAVMRYYHAGTQMITQGGKREGAQMAILHCLHPNIEEFINCKEVEGTFDTFNISVAATDEFMQNVDTTYKSLFDTIVLKAWTNGDPGLYFIDAAERANPTPELGKLTGTNPCGEVPLLDNEACNLGSINLSHFVEGGLFVFEKLRRTASLATYYLDHVVDNNFYVVPEIAEATLKTRKLGLGVMGWADTLALLRIPYASNEACDLADEVMGVIQDASHQASMELLDRKGPCPASKTEHNMCVTCIAPAGTISTIANCSSGIEPHISRSYTQVMGDGTKLRREIDFGDFVPQVANEIGWDWHVKHQAVFQRHTDLAVSKTINMPNEATVEDVRNAYMAAWESGCKGTTIYREGSRVKQAIYQGTKEHYPTDAKFGGRRKLAKDGISLRHKFDISDMEGYLHIGLFEDGNPGELFITGVKEGSTISGLLDGVAILTSLALQRGVPLEEMVSKLQGTKFEPAGFTSNERIPTATSVLDYIFRYMSLRCNGVPMDNHEFSGMLCPSCGALVNFQEGCMYCSESCGWSRC